MMYALSDISMDGAVGYASLLNVNYATWLSCIGGVAWIYGYSINFKRKSEYAVFKIYTTKLFVATVVTIAVFLATAGSEFFSGAIYKGQSSASVATVSAAYTQLLASILLSVLTAAVILRKSDNKLTLNQSIGSFIKYDRAYCILIIFYILLYLASGDRGGALKLMLCFLVMFGSLLRPIRGKEFAVCIIVGALLMTLIGLGRSSSTGSNVLLSGVSQFELTSGYDFTLELAGSVRTLYKAVDLSENGGQYFYGKLWLGEFLGTIPFSQNIYLMLSGDSPHELGSAAYITYMSVGPNSISGEGTSLVADIFLNFGVVGVLQCLFLLGIIFRKMTHELSCQRSYLWIVATCLMAAEAFYMSRGSLLGALRPIIWGVLAASLLTTYKRRHK